ncbi:hypothetical protein Pcac1_g14929 [Phytophthora cactorum]|uniref:FAR1 domain-containing protein n=1 Tax=Phytophthora cactorum TaxID=29920 RepID=A0A8T1GBL1_9STRA|nr:hypothetical protein Pcac1_g14929 [Phytophthora cactorum]KAG2833722.1 hypothetical protein PC112_g6376 [Phytophthora cactorum]KAG2835954.1 hypothetical protein PC111_g5244 [Phytophthora cactorum]KAG2933716.1 hypothetical protein PC115_g5411 [Phytophthora cactorum]KAG2990754.1 hypothetical protein PC118_g5457 [Phytophthora cactorum]
MRLAQPAATFTDPSKADRRGSSPPRSTSNDSSDEGEEGKRKRQRSRALTCEAQINACVQVVNPVGPKFALKVTFVRLEHNHSLSKYTFTQYPQNRTAFKPEVLPIVNELRKAETKKNSILANINDHSV